MIRVYDRHNNAYIGTMTQLRVRRRVPADKAYIYQSVKSVRLSLGRRVRNPNWTGVDSNEPHSNLILDTDRYRLEQLVNGEWKEVEHADS